MKFETLPIAEAEGAILAHSIRHAGGSVKKGTILDRAVVSTLAAAGVRDVVAARLAADDVHEDEAAARLARSFAGKGVRVDPAFTGRSNLYAEAAGVLVVDRGVVDRLNRVDPAITVATLPEFAVVEPGRMIGTVKMIPFAVPAASLDGAVALGPGMRVAAFRPRKVGLVATTLPSLKPSVMDKTRRLLEERLAPAGATLAAESRVAHTSEAVAAALADMKKRGIDLFIVFGASATVDARDVVPAGIEAAGGQLIHFGMPVDPGNLLVLGSLAGHAVIGAPGCARSPKENGFDWVLNRLLAGLDVTPDDLTGLGVGGLLMEIVSRPQPREGGAPVDVADDGSHVGAVILAAGQSRRMGGPHKLLATILGKPLVRIAAEAALASAADPVIVVVGHGSGNVRRALAGLAVTIVDNPDYEAGLSTSLRTGLGALPVDARAAVVLLADMPGVTAEVIDRLIAAHDEAAGGLIVVPTFDGKRGNPVLWSRRFFADLAAVQGDTGGRHLIGANPDAIVEVELGSAVALDIDTPEALAAAGGVLP